MQTLYYYRTLRNDGWQILRNGGGVVLRNESYTDTTPPLCVGGPHLNPELAIQPSITSELAASQVQLQPQFSIQMEISQCPPCQ